MGINGFPYGFNPSRRLVDQGGIPFMDGRDLLRALFNRTGAGTGLPNADVGVIAAGSSQADALLLAGDWNYIETVDSGTGVLLPPMQTGADCIVWNAGANALKVYPCVVGSSAGGPVQIDALGNNNPYSLNTGKMQWFRQVKPSLIKSMQLG